MSLRLYKISLAASLVLNLLLGLWVYLFSGFGETLSLIQMLAGFLD